MLAKMTTLALAMALSASPVLAGSLEPLFGRSGDCYSRVYDAAHLQSHPRQRVKSISVTQANHQEARYEVTLDLAFTLRDGSSYAAQAYCRGNACGLEGDGGHFRLAASGNDLRLSVVDFLELEGEQDFSGDLVKSDDRVFLLRPSAAAACAP